MFTKTVTYTDYSGRERTETFCFNLTKAELYSLQVSTPDGLAGMIQTIIDATDPKEVFSTFEKLVCMSYGEKSDDGRRFIKNSEVLDDFKHTNAYSDIILELGTDDSKAAEFIKGILPADLE